MLIKVGFDITYEVWAPTPMVLMLYIHPSRQGDLRQPDRLVVEPAVPIEDFFDSFGNRCARIVAPPGTIRFLGDALVADSGEPAPAFPDAVQHPIEQLPPHVLPYLLASRYCEVERFSEVGWNLFGQIPPGWARAQAICEWVNKHIAFGYHWARADKTAYEVYLEKQGVCRDFTHLAIALSRAVGLPARYATGYLGDIGVPPVAAPMDFSAYYEVYLGGQWHPFDARHNQRRIGRICQARGRDATDVALTTTFGKHALRNFTVWTNEVK
jgi:transglutaminase-like putative cysteine protease